MKSTPVPVLHAGVYHRPSDEFCLVKAIRRAADNVVGYDLWNDYARVALTGVPPSEIDVWRAEVAGITYVWRDLDPGMAMMWLDGIRVVAGELEPQWLDVMAIHRSNDGGESWEVDAVQGRYAVDPTSMFTEVTSELADMVASLAMEAQDRWLR